ncbi:NAP1-related protein 2 [Hibiscus syriacus]|uniref:NAP1-related protein 2 n=1 Tax=Hibiscus syriacus TaxID=106335 RepID=A0A6A3BEG6_HIBSY|nr:NAP1-related protein 2 [Hibiscus syriacus]
MVADKGKKMKVAENGEEEKSEQIDGDLILSIEKLQEIQDELEKLVTLGSYVLLQRSMRRRVRKFWKWSRSTMKIRKPIYDKRNEKIKSILDFWLTDFLSHPALGELLNEEDRKIFKYISSLEVEDFKDMKSGYSITFNFDSNPYFEDMKLTKTFTFLDEGTKIIATKIKWKEGMGLPNGVDHEKKGNKRQFAEEIFFTWFTDAQQKDDMDEIYDEVAEIIKEDLWPNPLAYFNTDADEDDCDGDEEGDGTDCVFIVTMLTVRDLVVSDFGFDGLPGSGSENDPTKSPGWDRFEFDKDAPLDDEEVEGVLELTSCASLLVVPEDDASLMKHISRSFQFSVIEARREEQLKAAHDEAIFGTTSSLSVKVDSETELVDLTEKAMKTKF